MEFICIEIATQTTSFRNPDFQNFHKTLDLPPPATLIGFAGAAMGLSPKMSQEFFDEAAFLAGVTGRIAGRATDTWKYNRRTSQMHLYDPLLDGGVVKREHLIFGRYVVVFGTEDKERLKRLMDNFLYPTFALTLGNSDSIAFIKRVAPVDSFGKGNLVQHCLMDGDVVGEVLRKASEKLSFSIYQTSEPITYDLPTRFTYKSDYGRREIAQTRTFSFIGQEMELNFDVPGIFFDDIFIPVFQL